MDESVSLYDAMGGSIGPQYDGTYSVPSSGVPANTPWDAAGGNTGNYGSDVLNVLKLGVGAWSADRANTQLLDYKRYEATNGGVYQQGSPAQIAAQASVTRSLMPLLLIAIVAYVVLKA
jgi:hypothetical protein